MTRWLAKAAVQGTISLLPRGAELNYCLQKNVSRRLPRSDEDFDRHAATAGRHLTALDRVRPVVDRGALHCYEFGAGWDLIGPISMWALGIDQQTIVDIRPNVKLELVNNTISRFAAHPARLERVLGAELRPVPNTPISSTGELVPRFGITYRAPQDARATPLQDGAVDFVSSTFTLEHIPTAQIAAILRETRRIMASDAVISSLIDMQDHYNYTDPSVSVYNFLRYPPWAWRLLNPGLHWQSRLRHSEYVELFERAGYETVLDEPQRPTDEDLRQLAQTHLASEFRRFSISDLGTRATHLVAQPRR